MADVAAVTASPAALPWHEQLLRFFHDLSTSSLQGVILLRVQFGRTEGLSRLYTQMWSYVPPVAFDVLDNVIHHPEDHTHYYAVNPSSTSDKVSAFFVVPRCIAFAVVQAFLRFINLTTIEHASPSVRTLFFSDDATSPTLVVLPSVLASLCELLEFVNEFNDCNPDIAIPNSHLLYSPFAALRLPGSSRPRLRVDSSEYPPMQLNDVVYFDRHTFSAVSADPDLSRDDVLAVCRLVRPSRTLDRFYKLRRFVRRIIPFYPPVVDLMRDVSYGTDRAVEESDDHVRSQHFIDYGVSSDDDNDTPRSYP